MYWTNASRTFGIGVIGLMTLITMSQSASAADVKNEVKTPPRLSRADSFFGLHLDFHCGLTDQNVGANTTPEMVNAIIDQIHPDYIQIDCKGHPGISSYPTRVGNPCPNIAGDPLRVWRDTTAARGVSLYMHYSGVWDTQACTLHPEWAAIDAAGKPSGEKTSVFGPYADALLIPQLKELALDYGVDGAWIDGECWATVMDYGEIAKQKFCEKMNITADQIPTKPDDPLWYEWATFHRDAFRDYLRHYLSALKEAAPEFQIASNWAFTDHMPEPVCADVAFLSGDYTRTDSVNAARYSSRFMASQGKPWDLMAWSFAEPTPDQPREQKPAVQLEREAACVLAQGGGFQAYYTQNRDGSLDLNKIGAMTDVAKFVRARQPFCQGAKAVPQVALLCPTESHYRLVSSQGDSLFPWSVSWQRGILQCLLENHYAVEILTEKTLTEKISQYPVVVVCEWEWLDPAMEETIRTYVSNGGNLLVIGAKASDILGINSWGKRTISAGIQTSAASSVAFSPSGGTYASFSAPSRISASSRILYGFKVIEFDQGRMGFIPNAMSSRYREKHSIFDRLLVEAVMKMLFTRPIVEFPGMRRLPLDVSVMRTADGMLAIHLVNVSGDHAHQGIIPEIKPVEKVSMTIRCDAKPEKVTLQPENQPLDFSWNETDKTIRLTVPSIPIHEIIVIDTLAESPASE